jgi:hypothetical protein
MKSSPEVMVTITMPKAVAEVIAEAARNSVCLEGTDFGYTLAQLFSRAVEQGNATLTPDLDQLGLDQLASSTFQEARRG